MPDILVAVKRGAGFGYASPAATVVRILSDVEGFRLLTISSGMSLTYLKELGIPVEDFSKDKIFDSCNHLIYPNEVATALARGIERLGRPKCCIAIGEYFLPLICYDLHIPTIFLGNLTYYSQGKREGLSGAEAIANRAGANSIARSAAIFHLGVLAPEELELPSELEAMVVRCQPPATSFIRPPAPYGAAPSGSVLVYAGSPIFREADPHGDKGSTADYRWCAATTLRATLETLARIKSEEPGSLLPSSIEVVTPYPEDAEAIAREYSGAVATRVTTMIPDIDRHLHRFRLCVVRGGANIVASCVAQRVPTFSVATRGDEQQVFELSRLKRHGYVHGAVCDTHLAGGLYAWMVETLREPPLTRHTEFHDRPPFGEALLGALEIALASV
jgi:hypothetical protein